MPMLTEDVIEELNRSVDLLRQAEEVLHLRRVALERSVRAASHMIVLQEKELNSLHDAMAALTMPTRVVRVERPAEEGVGL